MLSHKSNRFYFFIAGYSSVFVLLACFGAVESSRSHMEQEQLRETADHIAVVTKNKTLYKLPSMNVAMPALHGEMHHVQLGIGLVIDKKNVARFGDFQPRVTDRIITFLDHQDFGEFQGPNAMRNLRQGILYEVNKASGPVAVSDVVFQEFVVR